MGKDKGGAYTFAFNNGYDGSYADSRTTQVRGVAFPNPPGKVGHGYYQAGSQDRVRNRQV